MRLQYRGVRYDYTVPSLETREAEILRASQAAQRRCRTLQEGNYPLIYRGVRYTTEQLAAADATPVARSSQSLTYRGAHYTRNADGTIAASTGSQSVSNVVVPSTTAALAKQLSRVHHDNIRRNIERRLQAAKASGNQSLVAMLEAESRELAV
jgi:hypothetical protein